MEEAASKPALEVFTSLEEAKMERRPAVRIPILTPILKSVIEDKGASTPARFLMSQHVGDLLLIFVVVLALAITASWLVHKYGPDDATELAGLYAVISGTGFGVLAWTYQTASARLGVVDLFACEIATLCTVTAVAETATHLVEMYDKPPSEPFIFPSKEQYSPIFDTNSKELEVLEARVVEHVTEFYTYMKAMRDYLRLLSKISSPKDDVKRWNVLLLNVIYMLFLMLESARKAIGRLVDFHPEKAQYTITILLSELVAYGKLLHCCEKSGPDYNARLQRLRLREEEYPAIVKDVYWRTHDYREQYEWKRAAALLPELNHRYHDVFGEWIDPNTADLEN